MARQNYSIDLIKQMAECDANYIRLLNLVPQLNAYFRNSSLDKHVIEAITGVQIDATNMSPGEPEKSLEGLVSEFIIADLEGMEGKVTVEIKILEAFRYTTTLQITQKPEMKKWMTNPSMLVRLYHDANTAEVTSYQGHKNLQPRYAQPNPKMYYPDEKMQVNAFLGEWLNHCLKCGRSTKAPEFSYSS